MISGVVCKSDVIVWFVLILDVVVWSVLISGVVWITLFFSFVGVRIVLTSGVVV